MLRSRSAAAPYDTGSHFHDLSHGPGKLVRINIIDGPASLASWKSRIWIYDNRNRGRLYDISQYPLHLDRSQTTVNSQGIYAQSLQQRDCRFHSSSRQKLALTVKYHCGKDRKITVFLCSQNGRLHLVAVAHGFYQYQISTLTRTNCNNIGEQTVGLLEA